MAVYAEGGSEEGRIGNGNGEEEVEEEVLAEAEELEGGGIEEVGPAAADGGERREGTVRDSGEAFEEKVIREGGDGSGCGGDGGGEGGRVVGVLEVGKAGFHEP